MRDDNGAAPGASLNPTQTSGPSQPVSGNGNAINTGAVPDTSPISQSVYDDAYFRVLGEKLRVLEELRPILAEEAIDCPGIIVVGDQSSGKSSVLEGLTDIRFPRDTNTCTRTPTVVHLQVDPHIDRNRITVARYPDFRDAQEYDDMDKLQEALLEIATHVKGEGVPVKNEPVHIRYVRKTGAVMTLVDLPGIHYFDKNKFAIEEATVSMIREYAEKKNMIMLVVFPANKEFGTRAISIAQEYDEHGIRTIGVATFADMVPEDSENFLRLMRMEDDENPQLKHGFVAIRNRKKDEVNKEWKEIESVLSTHRLLRQLDWSQKGFDALTNKIVNVQSNMVNEFIPDTITTLRNKILEAKRELDEVGIDPHSIDSREIVGEFLSGTHERMEHCIRAEEVDEETENQNVSHKTAELFKEYGKSFNSEKDRVLSREYGEEVKYSVVKSNGFTLSPFRNQHAIVAARVRKLFFSGLIRKQTTRLINDVKICILGVYEELMLSVAEQERFPALRPALIEKVDEILEDARKSSEEVAEALISAERSNPFTLTEHFKTTLRRTENFVDSWRKEDPNQSNHASMAAQKPGYYAGRRGPQGGQFGSMTAANPTPTVDENEDTPVPANLEDEVKGIEAEGISREFLARWVKRESDSEVHYLQLSIYLYATTVLRRLCDYISMVVKDKLVFQVHRKFLPEILARLQDPQELEWLTRESDSIITKREYLKNRLDQLQTALWELEHLPRQ